MSAEPDMACVYSAEVMHQRFFKAKYRFRYRIFSVLLDIDQVDLAVASTRLFSRNRFNLLSFHDCDHLPAGEDDLRAWAEGVLAGAGIDGSRLKIQLLCFPRLLGWVFNPLSLWYCEDAQGQPVAAIAEVRNTFGERHCYLLQPGDPRSGWPLRQRHAKDFHVSPFIGMQAEYEFRLSRPGRRLGVLIREYQSDQLMLIASQTGSRRPFNDRHLLAQVLRVPFQTLKVLAAIHWQALKIWAQGARFHSKPAPPIEEIT